MDKELLVKLLDKYGLPTVFALLLWWTLDSKLGRVADEMHNSNVQAELQHEAIKNMWFELRDKR